MNLNLEDEGDGKKKKRKRRPVQGGGGESDEADSKNLKKLGKFQEGGGESDEADSSSDSKNLKKLGKSQEGGGESDEADSKIWKKLGKKISKCLTEASDSLQVLKDYNEALKTTNPGAEEGMKYLNQMIGSVSHLSNLMQNLGNSLPREVDMAVIKKNPFDVYPSSSESEFEGFVEPLQIAVGNLNLSRTTREDLINFFGGSDLVSDVRINHQQKGCVVFFKRPEDAKKALKRNGEDLHDHQLYITPQHKDRTVYHFSGYRSNWSRSKVENKFKKVFKWGEVQDFFFPEDESFGYAVVYNVPEDSKTYDSITKYIHGGFSIRDANLKVRICRAHLGV